MAIIAVARKLVTIAFLMLKNNEPYRYARPDSMRRKFMSLKVVPTRQKTQGNGAAGKPGLAEIYRAAGLPPVQMPDQLPKGEQQMLDDRKLRQFVNDLYLPPTTRRKGQRVSPTSATVKSGRPKGRPR